MAVTVITTVAAANANSYASAAEALTYHEAHPYATVWDDADADQRNRALVTATRLLDEHFDWRGYPVGNTQALEWPRSQTYERSGLYSNPVDAIPQEVKNATCELARLLLASDLTAEAEVPQGISQLGVGSVNLTFDRAAISLKVIPDSVKYMVLHLIKGVRSAQSISVPLERG